MILVTAARPPPHPPRLSSIGSGGWTRPPPTAGSTSSKDTTTGRPTYADAKAHLPGPSVASIPGAPSVTQLSSLRGILSLRPCTSLRPLTVTNWTHDWDDGNDKAGGREKSKDDNSNVNETAETTLDDIPAVKDTTAAALTDIAHKDNDSASVGSDSPPLLSSPDSTVPLTDTAPPPLDTFILDSSASIHYMAGPTPPPTLPIRDLPATAANSMATLQWAISDHLAKLDQQRISIGENMTPSMISLLKPRLNSTPQPLSNECNQQLGCIVLSLLSLLQMPRWPLT
jgi:hypothetical protein